LFSDAAIADAFRCRHFIARDAFRCLLIFLQRHDIFAVYFSLPLFRHFAARRFILPLPIARLPIFRQRHLLLMLLMLPFFAACYADDDYFDDVFRYDTIPFDAFSIFVAY